VSGRHGFDACADTSAMKTEQMARSLIASNIILLPKFGVVVFSAAVTELSDRKGPRLIQRES
jgi:hypothetical protein